MKLAIVHDYLNQYGGAERVVEVFHEIFPDAPIYTSIYVPENLPISFKKMDIRTSFMQHLPYLKKHFKKYFLLYPAAFRRFDLKGYDVILSSSTAYAKGIKVPDDSLHICYCNTPARFIWRYKDYMEKEEVSAISKSIIGLLAGSLKRWDIATSKNVHYFIANSENIKKRIWDAYKRDSTVIYPPIDTKKFSISVRVEDYYLVVSRLNAYKRVDLVIEAFNQLGLPLRIIGEGPYRNILQKTAGPHIQFLGKIPENALIENYAHCQALIFPGEEDFGIVPLEAQACGRPVIAYAAGGALETVVDGKSGIFFKEQTTLVLIDAVKKFQSLKNSFDSQKIQENAAPFDKEVFKRKISEFVAEKYRRRKTNPLQ